MDNHMEPLLGIISGTIPLHRNEIFKNLTERELETEFGKALVYLSDTIVFIPRHGKDSRHHILPHLINHQANLKALKDLGVKEVMGVNSTGSLKKELRPGIIVIPDDYLVLSGTPTAIH
jgi:5'-methylthioadenosine phosphorylase